ncbi:hypothetical protein Drorol1_Dr00014633, partial [Drosera rotundifolia]
AQLVCCSELGGPKCVGARRLLTSASPELGISVCSKLGSGELGPIGSSASWSSASRSCPVLDEFADVVRRRKRGGGGARPKRRGGEGTKGNSMGPFPEDGGAIHGWWQPVEKKGTRRRSCWMMMNSSA